MILQSLPIDLLEEIIVRCGLNIIYQLKFASRYFNFILSRESLWKRLVTQAIGQSVKVLDQTTLSTGTPTYQNMYRMLIVPNIVYRIKGVDSRRSLYRSKSRAIEVIVNHILEKHIDRTDDLPCTWEKDFPKNFTKKVRKGRSSYLDYVKSNPDVKIRYEKLLADTYRNILNDDESIDTFSSSLFVEQIRLV